MNRLDLIASYTKGSKVVCDIGCDHAYVLIEAVKRYNVKKGLACDVANGPLSRAEKSIIDAKLNNSIKEFEMDNDDKKYIPALRFPEFLNDEKWKIVNGNELFESIVNKKHDSNLPVLAITQEYGAVPRDTINYNVIVSDKSIEGYKVVEIGDFIISLRSFQGGIEYSRYKGICSPAYIILRKRSDNICNDFYRS